MSGTRRTAVCILWALCAGCAGETEPLPVADAPREKAAVLRTASRGAVAAVLVPHSMEADAPRGGVYRALAAACGEAPCSAAAFLYTERRAAARWIRRECERRRRGGRTPRVVLAGHSLGATAAGELAGDLLDDPGGPTVALLVTVDAIKTHTVMVTTGVGASVLTLANPIPGKTAYFTAYSGTPPADGRRLRAHVNYYQTTTTLYHGGPISGASENLPLSETYAPGLNHGNIDDYVYPFVLADLRAALGKGGGP